MSVGTFNCDLEDEVQGGPSRPLKVDQGARLWAALSLGVLLMLVAVMVLDTAFSARAFAGAGGRSMTLDEAKMGTLLFRTATPDRFVEAPTLGSDIHIEVAGPTARGRITQHFRNPTDGYVEAVYVMPLPEDAAVDTLKMVIGETVVIGSIKERKEARRIYERAKANGQKAALFTQERPNIFTHEVANIGPDETIVVQVAWQQKVAFDDKRFALRMPLVVGPRFNPQPLVQTVEFDANGGGGFGAVVDPVPDRARISPPVLDPAKAAPVNPVTLSVKVSAGFAIGDIKSHHHEVIVEEPDAGTRVVRLKAGAEPADRDFELTWAPEVSATPSAGLFRDRVDGKDYILAFVTPPVVTADDKTSALSSEPSEKRREMIFVIDNSGSMGGDSIRQARESVLFGLKRLKPDDTFNVIRFDDQFDALFAQPAAATEQNIAQAETFVSALKGRGGTMMVAPMSAALDDRGTAPAGALRQVVFLTDGAIGNEAQLMDLVSAKRGRSRVFMIGIGSAPNSYLMSRIAEIGRGTFLHIGSIAQVKSRMTELFAKLESPAVTNLSVTLDGVSGDLTPTLLPDLYRGEPLVISGQMSAASGTMRIAGEIGKQPWQVTLPLAKARPANGISKVWARRKIRDAEIAARLGASSQEATDKAVLRLALAHGLVSRLTSLVAVEDKISRPAGKALTRHDIPLNLPKGWDFEKVFGRDAGPRETRADVAPDGDAKLEKASAGSSEVPVLGEPSVDGVAAGVAGYAQSKSAQSQPAQSKPGQVTLARFAGVATSKTPVSRQVLASRQRARRTVRLSQTATDAELRLMFGLLLVLAGLTGLVMVRRRSEAGRR